MELGAEEASLCGSCLRYLLIIMRSKYKACMIGVRSSRGAAIGEAQFIVIWGLRRRITNKEQRKN